jgi:hypothetical protein
MCQSHSQIGMTIIATTIGRRLRRIIRIIGKG